MSNILIALSSYAFLPLISILSVYFSKENKKILIDKNSSVSIEGILTIYLIFHHFTQLMEDKWLIEPLSWIGWFIVGWFFLTSGYGLALGGARKSFWTKRLKRIWLPFIFAGLINGFLNILFLEEQYTVNEVVYYSLTLRQPTGKFM